MVVNLQKDSHTPTRNGAINPMVNARRVGRTKIGKYRLIALSIDFSSFPGIMEMGQT